jgi:purine nucleosidase
MTTAILLDVDTGVDDALAILLACASPELDVRGITCVAGNTELPDVVRNTGALLAMLGRHDVPLAVGADRALMRPPVGLDNADVHGGHGRGYADLPECRVSPTAINAAGLIVEQARAHPGEVTLIATGPLTNVALAIRQEPRLPSLLRRLVVMGGAFRGPGNTTPTGEFNIQADPEAARIAFDAFRGAAQRPLVLGLDVTYQVRLEADHIEDIARRAGDALDVRSDGSGWGKPSTPIIRYLAGALRHYAEWHYDRYGFYGTYLHDPLTVAATIDPSLVRTTAVAIDVECRGELTSGQTVADWDGLWGREPNADVALEVDVERALAAIVERVGASVAVAGVRVPAA